ncbi:MAG: CBS domain-containing protein [Chloroflexi bacterium]|nr:CBS domain-containing protein [Chloroflexota bacterium]
MLGAHKLYPQARPVLPHRINHNVKSFLALYGAELPFVDPESLTRGQYIQRVILVDTQSLTYVRGMSQEIHDVLIIDHHEPPEPGDLPEGWRFRGEKLGAATTLIVETLSSRLIPITRLEATLLLTGIYEDTGALTYNSTTPRDLRAAAWLLDHGANLDITSDFLEHTLTTTQLQIYSDLQEHAETLDIDGHPIVVAWAVSPPHTDEEISTLAHKLRDLLDPSALFILVEASGNTQLVARSTTDDINVADVAEHFGGGGHDRASAALVRQRGAQEVFTELKERLPSYIQPRVKVADLMSHGVRVVHPDADIANVAKQMLRTGHEGFPVVARGEQEVLGLVTRNAVDRALQHQWDEQPVSRIMQEGEVTVTPEDSAERVRTLMIQTGWGQIPVQERGKITGVVTRTDLIRIPPSEQETERQRIARKMAHAFARPLLMLIWHIGSLAAEQNHTIHFVGGIVRDLLLDQPLSDVDLVVEGDAIALGNLLVEAFGGEIRTHRRFRTVKWLLPEDVWDRVLEAPIEHEESEPPHIEESDGDGESEGLGLPNFIDLVTARTEFYEHPTALPLVESSSIKQDLHRRDFTINTLAIRLDPQRWGDLLNFYGGKSDLEEGVIRVLHSLSFVDDPTRILRAARFEARLGFQLDPRSEDLISEALPMLSHITGGRIRHELDLIFHEAKPEAALDRLQELGALQEIDPELISDTWLHERLARLRAMDLAAWGLNTNKDEEELRRVLSWCLFLYRLDPPAIERIANRLLMSRQITDLLDQVPDLQETLADLPKYERPSKIAAQLAPYSPAILAVAWLVSDDTDIRAPLARYVKEWRAVEPLLDGYDLQEMEIEPGPVYRKIFEALRAARLDGEISTREEEIARVKRWLRKHDVEAEQKE